MKKPSFFQKTAVKYALAGFACSVMSYFAWSVGVPVAQEFKTSFVVKEWKSLGFFGMYKKHFFTFVDGIDNLANLEKENEALNQKLATLEKANTLLETSHTERELASINQKFEEKSKEEAGSDVATLLENIDYEVPEQVSNSGLYALAIGYFKKQEFEKSAVLLQHLLTLKEDQQYVRAENFLMNGISWYHLKNYKFATEQFKKAKMHSEKSSQEHRSAVLWEALNAKAAGQSKVVQKQLLHFIELYPHSEESRLINAKRSPAKSGEADGFRPHLKESPSVSVDAHESHAAESTREVNKKETHHEEHE